jgi:hypothetical protein
MDILVCMGRGVLSLLLHSDAAQWLLGTRMARVDRWSYEGAEENFWGVVIISVG